MRYPDQRCWRWVETRARNLVGFPVSGYMPPICWRVSDGNWTWQRSGRSGFDSYEALAETARRLTDA